MMSSCGPDLISNIIHGGIIVSLLATVAVLIFFRTTEIRAESTQVWSLVFFAAFGTLAMFVCFDLGRWLIKVVT